MAIKYKPRIILLAVVAFVSIALFVYWMWPKKVDGFQMETSYPKTIYLIWRNMAPIDGNATIQAGFGDKVRGAISLYQYCRTHKVNLKIDIHQDTSRYFLKLPIIETKYDNKELLDIIAVDPKVLIDQFDSLLKEKDAIYCGCTAFPTEMTAEDKSFGKYLLQLKPEFKKEVDATVAHLPNDYGIKHYRFRDEIYSHDMDMSNNLFSQCFDNLKNTHKKTDVLMTNSPVFKKNAVEKLGIKTIECSGSSEHECKIAHIGMNADYKSSKFSYIEFFCICRAKYIDTYSNYEWVSGFVRWPASIFDIPIHPIKLE